MAARISEKMLQGLIHQANKELTASNTYLSLSLWFSDRELPGSAAWCRKHSEEEREHGLRIFDHVVKRRAKGSLVQAIEAQKFDFQDPIEAWETAFKQEEDNSRSIHSLVKIAREENDFTSDNFLQWFVSEQLEEETAVQDILINAREVIRTKGLYREYDAQIANKGH